MLKRGRDTQRDKESKAKEYIGSEGKTDRQEYREIEIQTYSSYWGRISA